MIGALLQELLDLLTFKHGIDTGVDESITSPHRIMDTSDGFIVNVDVSSLNMVDINDCDGTTTSSAISLLDNVFITR